MNLQYTFAYAFRATSFRLERQREFLLLSRLSSYPLQEEGGKTEDTSSDGDTGKGGTTGGGDNGGGGLGGAGRRSAGAGVAGAAGSGDVGGLKDGLVKVAGGIDSSGAVVSNADGLGSRGSSGRDRSSRRALVAEGVVQGLANNLNIGIGNTEGSGSETNLRDEVADLLDVKTHELVDLVHVGGALVRLVGAAELRAAEQVAEVAVKVGDQFLLGGAGSGERVVHEGSSSSTVEEVEGDTLAATAVGGVEGAGEVGGEVDASEVTSAGGEDTGDGDANVGLGVVSNGDSVDDEGQDGLLVGGGVLLEEGTSVVVADGDIARTLGSSAGSKGKSARNSVGLHYDSKW